MTDKNLYGRSYYEGGDKSNHNSGYQGIGYQNYPAQLNVLDKILARKPESLLDIGGARGYVARMFEQATCKPAWCADISEYCQATRVTSKFLLGDIKANTIEFLRPISRERGDDPRKIDLVFSIAFFEHIKEENLPLVIRRISNIAKRGLICPSLDNIIGKDDDHTHETLKSKIWWEEQFAKYAPGWPVEIMDKEDCEAGDLRFTFEQVQANNSMWTIAGRYVQQDMETLAGKNERRLIFNIGSYIVAWRSNLEVCVVNTDIFPDLHEFMKGWGANYTTYKAPERLNVRDNSIDAINMSHVFEHLTREEGFTFLQEVKRILKHDGVIRIAVPDTQKLCMQYCDPMIEDFNIHKIYNVAAENAPDNAQMLYELLIGKEHKTIYDFEALKKVGERAGFEVTRHSFNEMHPILAKVGYDMYPYISLFVEMKKK